MQSTQNNAAPKLPETGFVRFQQIQPLIGGVTKPTLWRWWKEGKFPAPIRLTPRMTVWRVEDVRAWLQSAAS